MTSKTSLFYDDDVDLAGTSFSASILWWGPNFTLSLYEATNYNGTLNVLNLLDIIQV